MTRIYITGAVACVLTGVIGFLLLPVLRALKAGQSIREVGPTWHNYKAGTPMMGGLMFIIGLIICLAVAIPTMEDFSVFYVLALSLCFGVIGFLDDYLKIIFRSPEGLKPWQKLLLQFLVTAMFAYYMVHMSGIPLTMRIPFIEGYYLDLGIWKLPALFVIMAGCANGTNFTDGLDGLAGSVTVMTAMFFSVAAIGLSAGIYPITCAVAGALLGFLLFNVHPASVFMGDTGSLALGGFLAATAYMMQLPLFLPIVGFVYVAEVLSVVIQVIYYKISGGKRIFKMAPIHHHFELCGFSENKIVAAFTFITAILCMVALFGI